MAADVEPDSKLKIAHVLNMDIVGYSTLLITEQSQIMSELTHIVRSTARFRQGEGEGKLLRIPTGDGMALVFFNDPEAPIECAMEITAAHRYVENYAFALGYTGLGENAKAIDWPERAYTEDADPELILIKVDPMLDPLRGDRRFEALVQKVFGAK